MELEFLIDPVELFLKNCFRNDPAETSHQVLQNCALAAWQRDGLIADPDVPTDRVEGDVARLQDRAERSSGSSQQGLGSRDELGHREGFDEIVIRAAVQAAHPILDGVSRGEDEDRNVVAARTRCREQGEPVAIG